MSGFNSIEEMFDYILDEVGYIFDNANALRDWKRELDMKDPDGSFVDPIHHALGFVEGVVHSSGFELDKIDNVVNSREPYKNTFLRDMDLTSKSDWRGIE